MLAAAHIINRTPLKSLNYTSPYSKLCGVPADVDHLRAFRCMCYVSTLKQHRGKFDPRAQPCVFLGYHHIKKLIRFLTFTL